MDWTPIAAVAARQHRLVTHHQLVGTGWSRDQIKRAIRDGLLVPLHRGVSSLAVAPATPEEALMASVLAAGPGAAGSHRSAGWSWLIVPGAPERPEISVPRGRSARLDGVVVHHLADFEPRWIRIRDGIPVTDPLHTMLVLGASLPRKEVADALERGVMAGLFSVASLEWVRAELAERGRNGCGVLREILDERALGAERPDGMLEPRMAQLCARYGVPKPVFQHRISDAAGRLVAKVDFAYPDLLAFLEVDGFDVHGTPAALESDLDRQNRLVALGWTPIRFAWGHLIRRPERVAQQITSVLDRLRRSRRDSGC